MLLTKGRNKIVYAGGLLIVLFFPYLHLLKFPFNLPMLAVICVLIIYWQNRSLPNAGFKKIRSVKSSIRSVLLSFLIAELGFDLVIQPLINYLFKEPADYGA